MNGFLTTAENADIAGFQTQSGGIHSDIGACFVDDSYNAKRYAHLADGHTVGALGTAVGDVEGRG